MIPALNGALLDISNSPVASIVVKATLAAALGLFAAWLARGSRASVRHTLLAATFSALLALPLASLVAPRVNITVTSEASRPAALPVARTLPIPTARPAKRPSGGISMSTVLLSVWAAGAIIFLLPVAMGLWQIRSLRRSALPWRDVQPLANRRAIDAGISRYVEVLRHESMPGPMTCGIVHPAIILSADAHTWSVEDLERALVHELEHVRRADWASHCVARAVCALYWFHPLVWMAWRRLVLEAERSCDDAVLARSEATAYAEQLVGLAQRLSAASKLPLTAMASRADLAARVGAVLDHRLHRGRAGRPAVAFVCVAAVALVAAISPLTMVAAPQTADAPIGRFAIRIQLVMVTLTVTDRNGLPIEGLTANDLVVTEDGMPQKIVVFEFQRVSDAAPNSPTSYYVLGYYANPNRDGKFRKIEVTRPGDPSAKLNFRAGYFVVAPPPGPPPAAGQPAPPRPDLGSRPPQLILKFEPEYSEEARKAKYQGTVLLNVEIDTSGHVTDTKIVRQLGLGLDEKAIEAVKRWRFKPGTQNGQPVTVWTQVEVSFRLL